MTTETGTVRHFGRRVWHTWAELEAASLLAKGEPWLAAQVDPRQAGDRIIELAARVLAERAAGGPAREVG